MRNATQQDPVDTAQKIFDAKPRKGSADVTVLSAEPTSKKNLLRSNAEIASEKTVQEVAAEIKANPKQANAIVAKLITGRDRGLIYQILRRSIKVQNIKAHCNGCGLSLPLLESDLSGWIKVGKDDYCADCATGGNH